MICPSARCVCLLPAGHRLASRTTIRAEDLQNEPFISLSEDSMLRVHVDRLFEARGIPRRLNLFARSPASICSFVRLGMGVSILNPFTAHVDDVPGAVIRPFEPRIEWPFVCVRPTGAELTPLQGDFMKTLDAAIRPYLD